jgi:hypothetical protein
MVIWTTGQDRDLFADLAVQPAAAPQAATYDVKAGALNAGPQAEGQHAASEGILPPSIHLAPL